MIKHIFKKEWFNPLFYYILHYLQDNDIREIYVYGGSSSAKTHSILQALMIDGYYRNYSTLVYRKEQTAIKTTVKNECKAIIENLNLTQYQEFDFEFRYNEQKLQFKGIDKEGKIKGLKGFRKLFFDEIDQFKEEEFNQAKLRLRGEENQQLLFSWNPVDEKHWLKSYLDKFEWEDLDLHFNEKHKKLNENSFIKRNKNKILIKTTYLDNRWVIGGDWGRYDEHVINEFETLKLTNSNLYNVYALGNWGQTLNKNPFFYALKKDLHYIDEPYRLAENETLFLSFDFNKDPVTLVIFAINKEKQISIVDLMQANEYTNENQTPLESVCNRFIDKYIKSGLVLRSYIKVTGDASGLHGGADKKANHSFFTTIANLLLINKSQLILRKANTTHLLSQEICNALIFKCDFAIYKSAQLVFDDMCIAFVENGSLDKAKKELGLHMTDAVRYGMDAILNHNNWKEWLIYYKKQIISI